MQNNIPQEFIEIKLLTSEWHPDSGRQGLNEVNHLLSTNKWKLISAVSGVDHDGYPLHHWVMGRIS
jgi:hypothetical protein